MQHYSLKWSPTAKITYFQILEYLETNWAKRELKSFIIKRTQKVIECICDRPLLYSYSREGNIHKCVVAKQVTLFYRIQGAEIQLLVLWDNRQSPQKLISILNS